MAKTWQRCLKWFGMTGGGDEDIIQIDKDKGEVVEKAVHEALEGLGGIAESKRHGGVLVEAKGVIMAVLGMSAAAMGPW